MKVDFIHTRPGTEIIAAAKTCYNGVVFPNNISHSEKSERFILSLLNSGHHTTFQHSEHYFTFILRDISRYSIWSFFHNFEHYNSSQVSQRYVTMTPSSNYVPEGLTNVQRRIWDAALSDSFVAYTELTRLCLDKTKQIYSRLFPQKEAKSIEEKASKMAIENARYILPQAVTASMYYTVNLATLLRMRAVANTYDCKDEIIPIVEAMCAAVVSYDEKLAPLFGSVALGGYFPDYEYNNVNAALFKNNFDAQFKDVYGKEFVHSKMIGYNKLPASMGIFEDIFGIKNNFVETPSLSLNVDNMLAESKIGELLTFTFANKNSLSCDSQMQRHRTIKRAKMFLPDQIVTDDIEYYTPSVIESRKTIQSKYESFMVNQIENYKYALKEGIAPEVAAYLLPNSVITRSFSTVDFNGFKNQAGLRLCFNAQKEIWDLTSEQAQQISVIVPELSNILVPKCKLRKDAKITPVCTEGSRFCGIQAWNIEDFYNFKRES